MFSVIFFNNNVVFLIEGTDCPDFEVPSYASDSVFHDEEEEGTENEIDEFSTDSDVNSDDGTCYHTSRPGGSYEFRLSPSCEMIQGCAIPSSSTRSSRSSSTLVGSQRDLSQQLSLAENARRLSVSAEKMRERSLGRKKLCFRC